MPKSIPLSRNENDFVKLLVDPRSLISITSQEQINLSIYGNNVPEEIFHKGTNNISLGQNFMSLVRTTHIIMLTFTPEKNALIANKRTEDFKKVHEKIYEVFYKETIRSEFKEYLGQLFFEATWLYYDPEKVKSYFENVHLLIGYGEGESNLELSLQANINRIGCFLSDCNFINEDEKVAALNATINLIKAIHIKFRENTIPFVPKKWYFIFGLASILIALAMEWVFSLPLFTSGISLLYFGAAVLGLSDSVKEHKMNANLEKEFLKDAKSLAEKADLYDIYQKFYQKERHSKEAKINMAVFFKYQALINTSLKSFKIFKDNEKSKTAKQEKNEEKIQVYTAFDTDYSSPYNYDNLKKYYTDFAQLKEEKALRKSMKEEEIKESVPNSYNKISFSLTPELQAQGCLVQKDESIAYFDFGEFINEVPKEIRKKIENNEYSFGGKKGEFETFKVLSNGHYAFKRRDGLRIQFEPESPIRIAASNGTEKQVDHYIAYRMGGK